VNSFHGQDHETERYDMNLGEAQRQGIRKGMVNGLFLGYSWCIIFISFAISFGVGALIFDYSADKITAVFYSVLMGALQLSQSAPNIEAIGVAKAAAYNVFEIIDRVSKIDPFSKDGIQISEKAHGYIFKA
jgi:ABC-type multidrug transport system fused ATPase/permease subunit